MEEVINDQQNLDKFYEYYFEYAKSLKHRDFVNGLVFDKNINPFDKDDLKILFKVTYEISNVTEYIQNINNYRDKLAFILNLKARSQHDLRDPQFESLLKPFIGGLEIEEQKYKDLINLAAVTEQEKKPASLSPETKQEGANASTETQLQNANVKNKEAGDLSLRQKVFILMFFSFGKLEVPGRFTQEKYVSLFQSLVGGERKRIREVLSKPNPNKSNKQSKTYLINDLIIVRDIFIKIGLNKKAKIVQNEINSIIEYIEEEKIENDEKNEKNLRLRIP